MNRERYEVVVTREGRWWIVDVPAIDYRTQARSLPEVEVMARDLIAGATDTDEASFDLDVRIEALNDALAAWEEASRNDEAAREAAAAAAKVRRRAVTMLRREHQLSAEDTARVLHVSRARVYQLDEAK